MQLADPRAERRAEHGDVEERLQQRRRDRLPLPPAEVRRQFDDPIADVVETGPVERVEQVLCERPAQAAALERTLRNLLSAMQRVNGQRAFGLCRQCAHFLTEDSGARCGLTREPLATEQTVRICREWAAATAERV